MAMRSGVVSSGTCCHDDRMAPGEGRFGLADEVAQAVLMLVGNAFMTGQTIAVNGGLLFT